MILLALTSGTTTWLIWYAVLGIAVFAVILYWPRDFSGPLTEQERRLARGRLRGPSIALTLATPILTVIGFFLLLPPVVHLKVPSQVMGGDRSVSCQTEAPWLSTIAVSRSTAPWIDAVRCHAGTAPSKDDLVQAIMKAAADGFVASAECGANELTPVDVVSIELSLVEIAVRAYFLTEVELDPGPRFTDPDPWDTLMRTLRARKIGPSCRTSADAAGVEGKILRLGPATVAKTGGPLLEVPALVRGDVCSGRPGRLLSPAHEVVKDCWLRAAVTDCGGQEQRVVTMTVACDGASPADLQRESANGGLLLSADHGEARVHMNLPVAVRFEGTLQSLWSEFHAAPEYAAFRMDLRRRGLQVPEPCTTCNETNLTVRESGADIVIEKANSSSGDSAPPRIEMPAELHQGPFSWSGMANVPVIECSAVQVTVRESARLVQQPAGQRDPSAMYALMNTIVWAANVLTNSSCAEIRQPAAVVVGARPLLTGAQLDEAVAAMRRDRETLGLVLLGFAVMALAFGLRRSVR